MVAADLGETRRSHTRENPTLARAPSDPGLFNMGRLSARYGLPVWKIRRLYERGKLPPARRHGRDRVVSTEELPALEHVMREMGYILTPRKPASAKAAGPAREHRRGGGPGG